MQLSKNESGKEANEMKKLLKPFAGKQVRITIEQIGEPRKVTSTVVKVPKK
jgi:hypothetical protein